jgi:hypothetical protein
VFQPRVPLTLAERQVDFQAHNAVIIFERMYVESGATPSTKRIAYLVASLRLLPLAALDTLERRLQTELSRVLHFGYRSAQAELRKLDASSRQKYVPTEPILAYSIPDAGHYARLARHGVAGIVALIQHRAKQTAYEIGTSATAAVADSPERDVVTLVTVASVAALKTLHNHVLELVGETLNLGRTAGAMAMKNPPEFALRSEQLDKATCDGCVRAHGEIYEVGSDAYFSHLPPTDCYGGGRCRGLMVFGYGPGDVRAPEPTVDELARIRKAA